MEWEFVYWVGGCVPPVRPGEDVFEAPVADEALAFGGGADGVFFCHFDLEYLYDLDFQADISLNCWVLVGLVDSCWRG